MVNLVHVLIFYVIVLILWVPLLLQYLFKFYWEFKLLRKELEDMLQLARKNKKPPHPFIPYIYIVEKVKLKCLFTVCLLELFSLPLSILPTSMYQILLTDISSHDNLNTDLSFSKLHYIPPHPEPVADVIGYITDLSRVVCMTLLNLYLLYAWRSHRQAAPIIFHNAGDRNFLEDDTILSNGKIMIIIIFLVYLVSLHVVDMVPQFVYIRITVTPCFTFSAFSIAMLYCKRLYSTLKFNLDHDWNLNNEKFERCDLYRSKIRQYKFRVLTQVIIFIIPFIISMLKLTILLNPNTRFETTTHYYIDLIIGFINSINPAIRQHTICVANIAIFCTEFFGGFLFKYFLYILGARSLSYFKHEDCYYKCMCEMCKNGYTRILS